MDGFREWTKTALSYDLTNKLSDFVIARIVPRKDRYSVHVWSNEEHKMQMVKEGVRDMFEAKQIALDELEGKKH